MHISCNGCRVLRKGCSENCSIRPCFQLIKSPKSQAHATIFLAKFYNWAVPRGGFSQYGDVVDSKIINDHETCRFKAFRFMTFKDEQSMRDAIEGINGQNLDGHSITVNEAQSRGSDDGAGGGFRSNGGGGRRVGSGYSHSSGGGYGDGGDGYGGGHERGYGGEGGGFCYSWEGGASDSS